MEYFTRFIVQVRGSFCLNKDFDVSLLGFVSGTYFLFLQLLLAPPIASCIPSVI